MKKKTHILSALNIKLIIAIIIALCIVAFAWYQTRIHYIRQSLALPCIELDINIYNDAGARVGGRTVNTDTDTNQINVNSVTTAIDGTDVITYNQTGNSITAYIKLQSQSDVKLDLYTKVLINNADKYSALESYFNSCIVDITNQVNNDLSTYITNNGSTVGQDYYDANSTSSDLKYYGTNLFDLQYLKQLDASLDANITKYYRLEIWTTTIPSSLLSSNSQELDFTIEVVGKQEGQVVDDQATSYVYEIRTEQDFLDAVNQATSGNTIMIKNDITVNGNVIFYKPVNLYLDDCTLTINGDLDYDLVSLYANTVEINLAGDSVLNIGYNLNINAPADPINIVGSNQNFINLGILGTGGYLYVDSVLDKSDLDKGFVVDNVKIQKAAGGGVYEDATIYVDSTTNVIIKEDSVVGQIASLGSSGNGVSNIYIYVYGSVTGGIDLSSMVDNTPSNNAPYAIPVANDFTPNGLDQIYIIVYGQVSSISGITAKFKLPSWTKSYKKTTTYDTDNCNTRIIYDLVTGVTDTTGYVSNNGTQFSSTDIEVTVYNTDTAVERLVNVSGGSTYGQYTYNGATYDNAYRVVIKNYNYSGQISQNSGYGSTDFIMQYLILDHFTYDTSDQYAVDHRSNDAEITLAIASIDYIEVVYVNQATQSLSSSDLLYLAGKNPGTVSTVYLLSGLEYLNLSNAMVPLNGGKYSIPANAFENSCLVGISLPNNLNNIYAEAFKNTKIAFIDIPSTVEYIAPSAFQASSDNGYGGYLFATLKSNNMPTNDVVQGFETNDKTYLFVNSSVEKIVHDYTSYYDATTAALNGTSFNSVTGLSSYWWYYIYENATLFDYSIDHDSTYNYDEYKFRFVRSMSNGYELAFVISKTSNASYNSSNYINTYSYSYLLPTTLDGKNVYALGNMAYTHSGIRNIANLDFATNSNYIKIGNEAFRVVNYSNGANVYTTITVNYTSPNVFNLGNINTIGDYAFACLNIAEDVDLEFIDQIYLGVGAFDNVTLGSSKTIDLTFLGNGTVSDYAFYKGSSGSGKINSLQLGSVDSIGAYAFSKNTITNIPYRNQTFNGMSVLGNYAFSECTIGTSGATSYDNTSSSVLFLDLSAADGLDLTNSYIFKSATFYGAVLKFNNVGVIDTTIFNSAKFTCSFINVDYAGKVVTQAFNNIVVVDANAQYVDFSLMNVPRIEPGAFYGYYFGDVRLGLDDQSLIDINNAKNDENYSWGGDTNYTSTFTYQSNPFTCGIFCSSFSAGSTGHGSISTKVNSLIIDGDIPYNTADYVFSNGHIKRCNNGLYHYNQSIYYDLVDFTDNFHGEIPAFAFSMGGNTGWSSSYGYGNYNSYIGNLVLGSNVTKINNSSFSGAWGLARLKIKNVSIDFDNTEISNYAFSWVEFTNITSLGFDTTTAINNYAFYNSTFSKLNYLNFESNVLLGNNSFAYCTFPSSCDVDFGDNVNIGGYSFTYATFASLDSIAFGTNVTIGDYAFHYADIHGLSSFTLPDTVVVNSYAFSRTDFFELETLTFAEGATLDSYNFYYATLPLVQTIEFETDSVIPTLLFTHTSIGTSYNGNVYIDMEGAESVGYQVFDYTYMRSYNTADGFDLNAKNVGKINPHAFGGVYWRNVTIGLTDTSEISDSSNYWGGTKYKNPGGIFTNYCPSDNQCGYRNGNNSLYTYVYKLTIDGEFPQNSASYCLGSYYWARQYSYNTYYSYVEITDNCSSIPDKAFGRVSSYSPIYIENLNIDSDVIYGNLVFYYTTINDPNITFSHIQGLYTANKTEVDTFNYSILKDYSNANDKYVIDFAISDGLFEGVTLYSENSTIEFTSTAAIGASSFESATFANYTDITFDGSASNYSFISSIFSSAVNFTIGSNATMGDEVFESASFPALNVLNVNADLGDADFLKATAAYLTNLNCAAGITIGDYCFSNTLFGTSSLSSPVFNLNNVYSIGIMAFAGVGCTSTPKAYSASAIYPIINAKNVGYIGRCAFSCAYWESVTVGLDSNSTSYAWGSQFGPRHVYGNYLYYGIFAAPDYYDRRYNTSLYLDYYVCSQNPYTIRNLIIDGELPSSCDYNVFGGQRAYWGSTSLTYKNVIIRNCDYLTPTAFQAGDKSSMQITIERLLIESTCNLKIGANAFCNVCGDLTNWNMTNVVELEAGAFNNVTTISSSYDNAELYFPDLEQISGDNVFLNCTAISSLRFGDDCEYIYGGDDFKGMTNLTTIYLERYDLNDTNYPYTKLINAIPTASMPSSLTKIRVATNAINYYPIQANWIDYASLFDYYLTAYPDSNGNYFTVVSNGSGTIALESLTFFNDTNNGILTIPQSMTIDGAVYTVTELQESLLNSSAGSTVTGLSIPSSITYIDPLLFDYATQVATISVDSGNTKYLVTETNQLHSYDCETLYRFMPASTLQITVVLDYKYIYKHAFAYSTVNTSLQFGTNLVTIGEEAFLNTSISTFTFNSTTPPILLGTNTFDNKIDISLSGTIASYTFTRNITIYVPTGCSSTYQNDSGFYKYRSYITEYSN